MKKFFYNLLTLTTQPILDFILFFKFYKYVKYKISDYLYIYIFILFLNLENQIYIKKKNYIIMNIQYNFKMIL